MSDFIIGCAIWFGMALGALVIGAGVGALTGSTGAGMVAIVVAFAVILYVVSERRR